MRIAVACLVLVAPGAASGDVVDLAATADATIFSTTTLSLGDSLGFVVGTNGQGEVRRALIRFDLSAIHASATITSAVLEATVTDSRGAVTASAHRLLGDWNEGPAGAGGSGGRGATAGPTDVTWLTDGLGGNWLNPGADFEAAATDLAVTPTSGAVQWDLTVDAQLFHGAGGSNFGWILIADNEGVASNVRGFASRTASAAQPVLRVEYVPTPGTAGLLALGLMGVRRRR